MNYKSNESSVTPTIAIYQNSEHVAGLLQQLFAAPVVTDLITESGREDNSTSATRGDGGTAAKGGLKAPGVGHVELKVGGNVAASDLAGSVVNNKSVQNFKYSQAYYLSQVRNELISRKLLKSVEDASDARQLKSGDFAVFRPKPFKRETQTRIAGTCLRHRASSLRARCRGCSYVTRDTIAIKVSLLS